jgi:hypothetical protein
MRACTERTREQARTRRLECADQVWGIPKPQIESFFFRFAKKITYMRMRDCISEMVDWQEKL